jgi:hypothetical protein
MPAEVGEQRAAGLEELAASVNLTSVDVQHPQVALSIGDLMRLLHTT